MSYPTAVKFLARTTLYTYIYKLISIFEKYKAPAIKRKESLRTGTFSKRLDKNLQRDTECLLNNMKSHIQ